jgi:hypothetical protein
MAKKSSHQEALDLAEKISQKYGEQIQDLEKQGAIYSLINGSLDKALVANEAITSSGKVRTGISKIDLQIALETLDAMEDRTDLEKELYKALDSQLQPLMMVEQGIRKIVMFGKQFLKLLLVNPVVAVAAAFAAVLAVAKKVLAEVNKIREEFGVTAMNAAKLVGSIKLAELRAKRFLLDSEDIEASYKALADTFGVLNHETVQFSVEVARVARNTGLGAENVAELLASITAATGQSKDLALDSINTLTSFARLEGVAPAKVLGDLAQNADVFASFIGRGEQNLIKAAAAARKVGLEFGSIVDFGDQLLNITDRLEKEQTLSIITGRQIRLDRVAILTSQGRIAEAQRELATQLRAVQGLSAQQVRFAAQQVGLDVNALLKLVQLGEAQLGEQQRANRLTLN